MAHPALVDLLTAPLRAIARAQRALSRSVLEWVRQMFPARDDGVGAPKMLAVSVPDPQGNHAGVTAPFATLAPTPHPSITAATIAFELEIVKSQPRADGAGLAFNARPTTANDRRRSPRNRSIRMELTVRAVPPTRTVEQLQRRLSNRTYWQTPTTPPRPAAGGPHPRARA